LPQSSAEAHQFLFAVDYHSHDLQYKGMVPDEVHSASAATAAHFALVQRSWTTQSAADTRHAELLAETKHGMALIQAQMYKQVE